MGSRALLPVLLPVLLPSVAAFNLETSRPFAFRGSPGSLFGFALDFYLPRPPRYRQWGGTGTARRGGRRERSGAERGGNGTGRAGRGTGAEGAAPEGWGAAPGRGTGREEGSGTGWGTGKE